MGEFILLSAQEQADKDGTLAEGVVREGQVIDEIIKFCEEQDPVYVVMGRPEEEREDNLLSLERLQGIVERINEVCQAQVVFIPELELD